MTDLDPLKLATGAVIIALVSGMSFAWKIINQVTKNLHWPNHREYTIYIAQFPDALILKFGIKRDLVRLPTSLRVETANWGTSLTELLTSTSAIVYTNRRTAGTEGQQVRDMILSDTVLCNYRGFAICFFPWVAQSDLGTMLRQGKLMVRKNTDQHESLHHAMTALGVPPEDHLVELDPDDDLMDRVMNTLEEGEVRDGQGVRGALQGMRRWVKRASGGEDIVGFVGGITERLLAEKLGFTIRTPEGADGAPGTIEDYEEGNCFAYRHSPSGEDMLELRFLLDRIEQLWFETVRQITDHRHIRKDYRAFLNEELSQPLPRSALKRLEEEKAELVSDEDLRPLLNKWLRIQASSA